MKANAQLHFDGHCMEAFKFYEKVLSGKVTFAMTWGESPMASEVAQEWHKKIIHATLEFGDQAIYGDDAPQGRYEKPQGIDICLGFKTSETAKAETIFIRLAENGKIRMPFGKTFFSPGFGMVVDQFGVPWIVHCEQK